MWRDKQDNVTKIVIDPWLDKAAGVISSALGERAVLKVALVFFREMWGRPLVARSGRASRATDFEGAGLSVPPFDLAI